MDIRTTTGIITLMEIETRTIFITAKGTNKLPKQPYIYQKTAAPPEIPQIFSNGFTSYESESNKYPSIISDSEYDVSQTPVLP